MPDAPISYHANIMTAFLDRLMLHGWVESYATDVNSSLRIRFSPVGVTALSEIRRNLTGLRPLEDIELSALLWIIDHKLPD